MNATAAAGKTPVHLWIVGVLSLLWNSFGAYDYVMSETHNADYLAMMGANVADMVSWLEAMPAWAVAAWAVGVWGSVLGSLLLLARSRYAVWAFVMSIVGALISFAYQLTSAIPASLDSPLNKVIAVVIMVLIAAQLWYANKIKQQGLLR